MSRYPLARVALVTAASSLLVASCGSESAKRRAAEGGAGGEAGAIAAAAGAGGDVIVSGGAPGTSGEGGALELPGGGEGGAEPTAEAGAGGTPPALTCADTCVDGACVFDECLPALTISSDTDLTTTAVTPDRACAEAPAWSVSALTATTVTTATAIDPDCLASGDEVLLLTLQGTTAATVNVGNWELLRVMSVQASSVGLSQPKLRFYGSSQQSDADLGTAPTAIRVALVRVPRFGKLTIAEGVTVTAAAWDGVLGGVLALRAGELSVDGAIDARELGYRGGRWSNDDITCSNNLQTEAGESIGGLGVATTNRNAGASGGVSAGSASFNANDPVMATAAHALAGVAGLNPNGRTLGQPGDVYGTNDGSKLTLGSGPGGAMSCDAGSHPASLVEKPIRAGGIIALFADALTVGATGSITASPGAQARVASAGGFVLLRGTSLSLGNARVTAQGATATSTNGPTNGQKVQAGAGYIVIDAADASGTTDPLAHNLREL